jgi:hypothetical protein
MTPFIKTERKHSLLHCFFLEIKFYNTGLYSNIEKQTRLCLETFEYIEADREIYRKRITKSKQYSTTLHVRVSDYFTYSTALFITLRHVTLRTSQNLTKQKKNYVYNMEGTMGPICPQVEININKK